MKVSGRGFASHKMHGGMDACALQVAWYRVRACTLLTCTALYMNCLTPLAVWRESEMHFSAPALCIFCPVLRRLRDLGNGIHFASDPVDGAFAAAAAPAA